MTEALDILLAFVVGFGSAFQVAMLGELRGERGSFEASWINTLGAMSALTVAIVVLGLTKSTRRTCRRHSTRRSHSLGRRRGLACVGAGVARACRSDTRRRWVFRLHLRPGVGVPGAAHRHCAVHSAVTAGTLIGGVGLDHFGAFGNQVIRIDALKVMGLAF